MLSWLLSFAVICSLESDDKKASVFHLKLWFWQGWPDVMKLLTSFDVDSLSFMRLHFPPTKTFKVHAALPPASRAEQLFASHKGPTIKLQDYLTPPADQKGVPSQFPVIISTPRRHSSFLIRAAWSPSHTLISYFELSLIIFCIFIAIKRTYYVYLQSQQTCYAQSWRLRKTSPFWKVGQKAQNYYELFWDWKPSFHYHLSVRPQTFCFVVTSNASGCLFNCWSLDLM